MTSILLEDALLLALMKQASCLGGMAHVTWNWGGAPDNSQQRSESLSPTVLEDWRLAFRRDPSCGKDTLIDSHVKHSEVEDPVEHAGFLTHRNCLIINVCSSKLVSFRVVFYISISSVQFSHSVVSNSLRPHELQHARPPCPSPTPGIHSDSRPLSQWCHPAISSSVVPFSSCPQSLPISESFPMSQLFAWGGQSTGVSALASFLPKKSQGWSPSEWTGWISLQSKGLSRVFSNTTVQKHQFFRAQPSSQSNSHIHTWPQEKP